MEFVNGKDDIPYILENKNMFETTNQLNIHFPMVFLWFSYGFPMIMFETTNQYDLERIETLRHESIQIHQPTRSSDLKTKTKDCTVAGKHDDDNDVDW